MVDCVEACLDVKRDTARDLVFAACRFPFRRNLHDRMLSGDATFDRTVAAVRLADTGVVQGVVDESYRYGLAGVWRLVARTKRVTRAGEREVFAGRYFTIQPNLDESRYRMWGEAPGIIGRTIDKAICDRADQLRTTAGDLRSTRGQRQLDALGVMALDSLTDTPGETSPGSDTGQVTVFIDARHNNPVEATTEIEYGPRVGPDALEEMMCEGKVQIVGLDTHGIPVVTCNPTTSPDSPTVAPTTRTTSQPCAGTTTTSPSTPTATK